MSKRILSMLLIVLVMNMSVLTAFAETKAEKEAKFSAKVKANVIKLGTGTEAKVQVKLKDGTKLKGYISQINEDSFVVVEEKSGASTEILYPQAKQIKGNNLSTGVKIAIAAAIVFGAVILIYALTVR